LNKYNFFSKFGLRASRWEKLRQRLLCPNMCDYSFIFNSFTIRDLPGNKLSVISPRSGQPKDFKIGICCFSTKHVALRRKSKDWFTQNQDNVSEWGDMSISGLLFQWASIIKIQLWCWSSTKRTSSSFHCKLACSCHDIAEKLLSWR
jgi:hypothetical protein